MTRYLLTFFATIFLCFPAYAQLEGTDSAPGDSCAGLPAGATRMNADAGQDGTKILLICDGTAWQSADTGGLAALQGTNDAGPCTVAKDGLIKYNASETPPWHYCDGGTTSWLPFRLPQCQDDGAGECTLPLLRTSGDPSLVPASIRCGLNILGVTGTYDCTTDPAAFSFTDVTGQNITTLIASNTLTPTGYTDPRPVSVSGSGSPQFSVNGGAWVTSGWILPGYTLQTRLTSATAYDTPYTAVISIGGISDTWSVRTKVQDTTPNAFTFTDQTNVELSTLATSANITPTGYDGPVTVSVSGQGSPQVSINGGAWGSGGNINPGQTLAVRLTSSAAYLTTLTATVTVGGTSDNWTVQSRSDATVINITGNQTNVNLFTLAGSPATLGHWEFVIAAGAKVSATSTATAALSTGAFPVGSTVRIINNGSIYGKGGGGGSGGTSSPTIPGSAGGNALSIGLNVLIDNTNGFIFGGGGGGGQGGRGASAGSVHAIGGSGGGGGQGDQSSAGGAGNGNPPGGAWYGIGNSGTAGTSAAPGTGGAPRSSSGLTGGRGGDGGAWGTDGATGLIGSPYTTTPSVGGAAGKAIALNSNTVTWLGGNDGTHVKGLVN